MMPRDDDDDYYRIDDDDSDIESDGDICERCDCSRARHENGEGECACGHCRKFKD